MPALANGAIRGVIKLPDGLALPSPPRLSVVFRRTEDFAPGYTPVETDLRGQFRVEGLVPGTYEIRVTVLTRPINLHGFRRQDKLSLLLAPVSTAGYFFLSNVTPGRYWMMARAGGEDTRQEISKIRLPDAAETRSSLRHDAEKGKTEIELKPCQGVTFKLPL
ncbi:MAG TPA: carboxypeptidase-like regulatory domain-containing protein [Pyrinomonadaceae bacterium]|nr:carboxypeptidase-like regulatory domain-containing protein [Pyrinomonadaceae bacterium]